MRRERRWVTSDLVAHANEKDAKRHAEKRYGEAVSRLSHEIAPQDKYQSATEWVDGSLGRFADLIALKRDCDIERSEDDDD
jgi:hypothetical protein